MAEDKNKNDEKQNRDENDPFSFFKFEIPEDDSDDKKKNRKNGKKKFPFWAILIVAFALVTIIDLFVL